MKPKVGDLVVMRDESTIDGMMGVVITEEKDHYYGRVLINGKVRMFGGDDVELIVQSEKNSYSIDVL